MDKQELFNTSTYWLHREANQYMAANLYTFNMYNMPWNIMSGTPNESL